jgi:hypothetical protein
VTIREHIRRRFWTLALLFAIPYAALQVMRVWLHFWPNALAPQPRAVVLILTQPITLLVFVGWFVVRTLIIPCPRCGRPLGAAVTVIFGNKNVHRCPSCRVSLDASAKAAEG